MALDKTYSRIDWENAPSFKTPINETNLNKIDYAVNEIDDRVISLEQTKANQSDWLVSVKTVTYDEETGVFTVVYNNGTSTSFDTKLEKLAVNFSYNSSTQKLVITLDDGTTQSVDLSSFITEYEFANSNTIRHTVDNGKVRCEIVEGSIEEKHLVPQYMATITGKVNAASTSATNAANSASAAKASATNAANSASEASSKASAADTSASNAKTSETNAANSATTASTSAAKASTSATNAASSASTASTKASEASTSATKAANSASAATSKATAAANSASDAATSETNAANSAAAAADSAEEAAESANTASTKASEASTSATNAASSANTASSKASAAASSANTASSKASAASASATAAANSASTASSAASTASTKATAASNSASAAAASATAAAKSAEDALTAAGASHLEIGEGLGLCVNGHYVSLGRTIKANVAEAITLYQDGQQVYITDWDRSKSSININVSANAVNKLSLMTPIRNDTYFYGPPNTYVSESGDILAGDGWDVHRFPVNVLARHDGYLYFKNVAGSAPCVKFVNAGGATLSVYRYANQSMFKVPIPTSTSYIYISYYRDGGFDSSDIYIQQTSSSSTNYTLDTTLEPPVALFALQNGTKTVIMTDADITIQYGDSLPTQIEMLKDMYVTADEEVAAQLVELRDSDGEIAVNDLWQHAYAKGTLVGDTTGVTINFDIGHNYVLYITAINISTGAVYGQGIRYISTKDVSGAPAILSGGQSSSTGWAQTAVTNGLTLKCSSASYTVKYALFKVYT